MSYKGGLNALQSFISNLEDIGLSELAEKLQKIFDSIVEDNPDWHE